MSNNNDDDWDFKIEHGLSSDIDKKPSRKKQSLEDIAQAFAPDEPTELTLDHESVVPRSTRIENFKKSFQLERFAEIKPAPVMRRVQAALLDLAFITLTAGGTWLSFPLWRVKLEKELPPGLLGGVPYPELVLEYSIPLLTIFVIHVIPSCLWKKSLGKRVFNLRIGCKDDDSGVSKKAVLWRELIVKPISCLSILGLLLIFINKRHRSLHDFLSGTVVYDEL